MTRLIAFLILSLCSTSGCSERAAEPVAGKVGPLKADYCALKVNDGDNVVDTISYVAEVDGITCYVGRDLYVLHSSRRCGPGSLREPERVFGSNEYELAVSACLVFNNSPTNHRAAVLLIAPRGQPDSPKIQSELLRLSVTLNDLAARGGLPVHYFNQTGNAICMELIEGRDIDNYLSDAQVEIDDGIVRISRQNGCAGVETFLDVDQAVAISGVD